MSDEEANRKVSLTIQIPNYALKHLEAMAARMGLSVESLAAGEIHHAIDSDRSWYKATEIEWQSGQWISRHLFPPPQYYFSAGIFEQGETLYETVVDDPVLKGIVDGVGQAAPWTYAQLLEALRNAMGSGDADAFHVAMHDNMVPETRWVRRYDWTGWWHPLYALELEPGADQGGSSYVGILSRGRDWLLMHDYSPCNWLKISFHGHRLTCDRVRELLKP